MWTVNRGRNTIRPNLTETVGNRPKSLTFSLVTRGKKWLCAENLRKSRDRHKFRSVPLSYGVVRNFIRRIGCKRPYNRTGEMRRKKWLKTGIIMSGVVNKIVCRQFQEPRLPRRSFEIAFTRAIRNYVETRT